MIEPSGPLPPSVYWRRRALAAGACLLAITLLAWLIGALVGSADEQPLQGTAGAQHLSAPSSPPPPGSAASSSTSVSPSVTTVSGSPAAASTAASPTSPARPTRSASVPAGPPKRCPDAAVRVVAQPGAPAYRLGERPLLRLRVVNVGEVPCTRDVGRALRELVITTADSKRRLWSSNDCYGPPERDRRTLAPGKPLHFSLNWAGRTSEPGCPLARTRVEPGRYRLIGKLGNLTGPATWLTLTR